MADMTGDMPEQKGIQLNPELVERVAPADREAIELVECLVREHPWHVRMGEGILHHLAGELAGIVIGTGLVLCGIPQFNLTHGPKSSEPQPLGKICIESQVILPTNVEESAARQTLRLVLVPCPPADDTTHANQADLASTPAAPDVPSN